MEDYSLPLVFDKCPWCGCEEKITVLACQDVKDIPEGTPVAATRIGIPLMGSHPPIGLTIQTLLLSFDYCAECGRQYLVKAEKVTSPIQFQMKQGQAQGPGGNGPGLPPFFGRG